MATASPADRRSAIRQTRPSALRGFDFAGAIVDHADFFHGDQAALHHLIECGEEFLDVFFGVDDFDDERQVHGEAKNLGGVEAAGFAEAHHAAGDGGAGEMEFAGFEDDGFVEGVVLPAIGFADENSQQSGFVREVHINVLWS